MVNNKQLRWGLVLGTLFGVAACTNDIDPNAGLPTPSRGEADFTKYVAVGNSLTAGYQDGGLYREGQLSSYPALLAGQFKTVGGGDFVQPLFSEAQANGSGYLKLTSLTPTTGIVLPGAARGGQTTSGQLLLTKYNGASQNLGVPGIRMADIQRAGYGSVQGNAFFERLLPDNSLTTYLQYVSDNLNGATFFSCWLGNNDALGYATSGGVSALTEEAVFNTNYTAILNKLTENNRKGIVIGIPPVSVVPFFTTVTLPQLLAQVNAAVQQQAPGTPAITALVIQSPAAPGGVRATKAGDLLLLQPYISGEYNKIGSTTAGTGRGPYGLSATNPLPSQFVLDAEEVALLNQRIAAFNQTMKTGAEAKNIAYLDPGVLLTRAQQGITENGVTYNATFVQGGIFSLDGVHLTPAGYALTANDIINTINAKYKATIPTLNASRYRRVLLQP
ncbi:SGNH/GDSL hydrolase family protein [Rudanella paleaurantiibacter]|uniref:SGNH/GDSL hydrolase family protein n=1 Tax=Rudanella paleaurantiibacter TaxID=2614655 RepID=A0A7J5TZ66_9BACT|nr:SGNH/GDSL hydrolase family protein [Rudanella paleaurantiibacter]KAB7730365.1 SGNH/GDSL hydrolase family protein [Rudanella paleaurantiibacter]